MSSAKAHRLILIIKRYKGERYVQSGYQKNHRYHHSAFGIDHRRNPDADRRAADQD